MQHDKNIRKHCGYHSAILFNPKGELYESSVLFNYDEITAEIDPVALKGFWLYGAKVTCPSQLVVVKCKLGDEKV
jgi:hypothetical protein